MLAVGIVVAPAPARVVHHNPIGVPDPTGDSNGAPDIVRVTVANDTLGRILFLIQVTNRESLVANDVVFIRVDSDRSAQTGEPDRGAGIDYMIEINATAPTLRRWNGSTFEAQPSTGRSGFDGGYFAVVNRSELGNADALRFHVLTAFQGASAAQTDTTPDTGLYEYALSVSHVDGMLPRWTPAAPRAGATFRLSSLRVTLQTGDTLAAARSGCRATLAGKRLRGTGRGACTFRLPRSAKGKRLVVDITAAPAGGEAETGRQTFRVR